MTHRQAMKKCAKKHKVATRSYWGCYRKARKVTARKPRKAARRRRSC